MRQSSPIPPNSQIIRLLSDFWQRHVMPESKRVTFTDYSRKEKCNWRILDSAKLSFNYKRCIKIPYKHAKLQGVLYPWAFLRNGLEHEFMATRKVGRNYGRSVLLCRKEIGKSMMEILLYAWSQYKSILHTFNYRELCHMVSIFCKRERPVFSFNSLALGTMEINTAWLAKVPLHIGFVSFPSSLVPVCFTCLETGYRRD